MLHKTCLSIVLFGLLVIQVGCSSASNNHTAVLQQQRGRMYLKLKGKRFYIVHDPVSALLNKTYEDSISFQLPALAKGLIQGSEIPVRRGYHSYSGTILLQPKQGKVTVDLSANNYDDHRRDPLGWNGEYDLVIRQP